MLNSHSGRISDHMYPFYRVFDEKGEQYCDCSHEQYAIRTVELHAEYQNEKFTYRKINALDKRSEELYSELQTALELYDQESLQSKIAEKTSKWGVYESKDPPKKIELINE